MSDEINTLHQQIKSLLDETVGAKGDDLGKDRRMSDAERHLLIRARMANGPRACGEWRKGAF